MTRQSSQPRSRPLAVLAIAVFTLLLAGGLALTAGSVVAENGASISGEMTDVDTGIAIENAEVTVRDDTGETVATAHADPDGRYSVDGLTDGSYTLTVNADEYDTQSENVEITGEDAVADFELGTTPRYEFTLAAGDVYAVGFPGPLEQATLGDVFNRTDFSGVVYAYDASADAWSQVVLGQDVEVDSLDAVVVVVDEDQDDVGVTMEFAGTAGVDDGDASERQLEEGWNFVSAPQSDADEAFDEAEVILDRGFAEPASSQVEGEDDFEEYTVGAGDLRVNPFKGYFVRADAGSSVTAQAYEGITRTQADGLLGLGSGTLEGTVTDVGTGKAIDNATVTIDGVSEVQTDSTGAFTVEDVPAGLAVVTVEHGDFTQATRKVAIRVGETRTADFQLFAKGSVTGEITGVNGTNLTDSNDVDVAATIRIEDQNSSYANETTTGAGGGNYKLTDLRSGTTYDVNVTAEDHVPIEGEVHVPADDPDQETDYKLVEGGFLNGSVVNQTNGNTEPVAGATVNIRGTDVVATTDENGEFETDLVPTGDGYTVEVSADGFSTRTFDDPGIEQGANSRTYRLIEEAAISGQLTDQEIDEPITNGTVVAVDTETGDEYSTDEIDENGNYTLTVAGEAEYDVTGKSPDHFESAPVRVAVGDGEEAEGIDFALEPRNATIEGTITDSKLDDDDAIEGVTVTVEDANGGLIGGFEETTQTDANGSYAVDVPAHGEYNITVEADDHENPNVENRSVGAGDAYEGGGATVDFALEPLPTYIEGRVTDAELDENDEIAGANVTIELNGTEVGSDTTDENGAYRVDGLAPHETYGVSVEADDHEDTADPKTATVGAGDAYKDGGETVDVELDPLPGTISGTLTDSETGDPISGATVEANDGNGTVLTATTDDNGTYTITNVPSQREYRVFGDHGNYEDAQSSGQVTNTTVGANEDVEAVDIELDPKPATVTGTVTDAELEGTDRDATIEGVDVTVHRDSLLGAEIGNDTTDANGEYAIEGVPADGSDYVVEFAATDHEDATSAAFTPDANEEVVQDASLEPLDGVIQGDVTDNKTGEPVDATVEIISEDGEQRVRNTGQAPLVEGDGEYAFHDVNASKDWTITVIAEGYADDSKERFLAANGNVVQDFQLDPLDGSISGTVQDVETGAGIADANVTVTGDGFEETVGTDKNGSYHVDVPTPAEYEVTAEADNYISESATVNLDSGEDEVQDFELQPSGYVYGQVTDDDTGAPIENAEVTIFVEGTLGEDVVANATSGEDGTYETDAFETGEYQIRIEAEGYETIEGTITVEQGANERSVFMRSEA